MNHHQQQQFQQNMQTGSGLTRYRSAPSSYFTTLLNSDYNTGNSGGFGAADFDNLFNSRASSPETQKIFTRFMNSSDTTIQESSQFLQPIIKNEPDVQKPQQRKQSHDYSSVSQMINYSGSINSNQVGHVKIEEGVGGNSGLIRQQSSPAGLFDNMNIVNVNGRFNKSQMMPPIPESGNKGIGEFNSIDGQFNEDIPGFPMNSWDDSSILSDNFLKGLAENDDKTLVNANPSNDQNNEGVKRLSHHLSLPTSSAELSAMEKFLQDSVPCKLRAKRGFATHPRSVAERVRRTKISDRIRKLQELVPNMEKQTNTSDMLDFAADYIKDLQRRVKTLSDNRAKCSCSGKYNS